MKKSLLLIVLFATGFCFSATAQFFVGVGANASYVVLKDSYVSQGSRSFTAGQNTSRFMWSPALRGEYVLSANSYVSGTFSHVSIKEYGYETQGPNSVFTGDKIRGIQGRFMGGWVFDHFGLEGGVVLLQSYKNERTHVIPPPDIQSSIADIQKSTTNFTQLYPCISGTYKHGQWLGVLSGTFSSDRFNPKGQTLTTVVPQATLSFGVFYLWKAVASPRLASPRF